MEPKQASVPGICCIVCAYCCLECCKPCKLYQVPSTQGINKISVVPMLAKDLTIKLSEISVKLRCGL